MRVCQFSSLLVLVLLLSSGCAATRQVVRTADHGVIAIPSDSNSWPTYHREKAHELMRQHFPGGYVIEHEEEVVVGQRVHVHSDETGGNVSTCGPVAIGVTQTNATVVTTDETEWRIRYRRK